MTDEVVPPGSVRSVAAFSTGRVKIHPQHEHGSRLPSLAWILLSPTWGDWRPIHVFVIEHEGGLVLFDAGQDRASITDPDYFPSSKVMRLIYRRLARFEIAPDETVSAQLGALGYRVEDIRWVVLSHLHQDHIGGLRELTGARFVVSATECRKHQLLVQQRSERCQLVLPSVGNFASVDSAQDDLTLISPYHSAFTSCRLLWCTGSRCSGL